jgi:SET domain-containing protein
MRSLGGAVIRRLKQFLALYVCHALQLRTGFSRVPKKNPSPRDILRVRRCKTGLGIFALAPIRRGQFIIEYWGKRIRTADADELNNRYMFEISSRWTIDGADRRNLARYINHACRPNAEARISKGSIRIHAVKNIQPGDEITYHYGRPYFEQFLRQPGCKCRACGKKPRSRARNGHA